MGVSDQEVVRSYPCDGFVSFPGLQACRAGSWGHCATCEVPLSAAKTRQTLAVRIRDGRDEVRVHGGPSSRAKRRLAGSGVPVSDRTWAS